MNYETAFNRQLHAAMVISKQIQLNNLGPLLCLHIRLLQDYIRDTDELPLFRNPQSRPIERK